MTASLFPNSVFEVAIARRLAIAKPRDNAIARRLAIAKTRENCYCKTSGNGTKSGKNAIARRLVIA